MQDCKRCEICDLEIITNLIVAQHRPKCDLTPTSRWNHTSANMQEVSRIKTWTKQWFQSNSCINKTVVPIRRFSHKEVMNVDLMHTIIHTAGNSVHNILHRINNLGAIRTWMSENEIWIKWRQNGDYYNRVFKACFNFNPNQNRRIYI